MRLIVLAFLVSGLALLAQMQGSITQRAVPFIATLLSLAFIVGVYAAWMEVGSMSKRHLTALHAGNAFGPWDVIISDDALEASTRGYSIRLNLASIRDVAIEDLFIVMTIDPSLDFALPKHCFGDDGSAEAFKRFVEARRAGPAAPSPK